MIANHGRTEVLSDEYSLDMLFGNHDNHAEVLAPYESPAQTNRGQSEATCIPDQDQLPTTEQVEIHSNQMPALSNHMSSEDQNNEASVLRYQDYTLHSENRRLKVERRRLRREIQANAALLRRQELRRGEIEMDQKELEQAKKQQEQNSPSWWCTIL